MTCPWDPWCQSIHAYGLVHTRGFYAWHSARAFDNRLYRWNWVSVKENGVWATHFYVLTPEEQLEIINQPEYKEV